jgi:serine protease Do
MKRNAVAWAALVVSAAALASSQGLTPRVPAAPELPAEGQKTARALSEAFEAVADFIKPSVVQITVQRKAGTRTLTIPRRSPNPNNPDGRLPKDFEDMLKRFFGPDFAPENQQFGGIAEGTGSGFVYDDKGHILTNNHVVSGAEKITVTFHDGTEAAATVVGTDKDTDVAVIKVDNTHYRPVQKGQSKGLKVGEWVLAVGSPFGLEQTVTAGIISATERDEVGINKYESFIQTDASINPGNSGGPLVDMDGRVVGINSAIVTGNRSMLGTGANAGVGFAIPIDMASTVADKLIKDGKVSRARLGVRLEPLTPALSKQLGLDEKTKGTLVIQVVPGSPADKAGLKEGDVIVRFDSKPIPSGSTLVNLVGASDVGKTYSLDYLRDGKEQSARVVPAPEDQVVFDIERQQQGGSTARREAPKPSSDEFGLSLQPLTPELASQFGYPKGSEGLVVTSVKEDSPAAAAGLEAGDLITKVIQDKKIRPVEGLKEFENLASKSDELGLFVQSADTPGHFVTLSRAKKD